MKRLPKYKIVIDEEFNGSNEAGWLKTAFTKKPAIIVKGMAFSASEEKQLFFSDDLKYRIAAPAIIPTQIYRNQDGEEFYVEFTQEEIDKIHQKFMSNLNNKQDSFNLEHNSEQTVPAFILEAWVVDNPLQDKAYSTFGIEVPKGSLFLVAQITDKEYYKELVANGQTGFSIEGYFGLDLAFNDNKTKENTEIKMEKFMLPDGEWTIEKKIYVVKDGEIIEVKDVVEDFSVEEPKKEEVAMAEVVVDAPVEDVPVTEEVKVEVEDSYSKEEIDAKFEELYQMIAELKASIPSVEAVKVEQKFNSNLKPSLVDNFAKFMSTKK